MAGIPNITGSAARVALTFDNLVKWGAFSTSEQVDIKNQGGQGSWRSANLNFDASKSNSIYGSSTTVTPLSLSYLPVVKY